MEGVWEGQCHGVGREEAGALDEQRKAGMRKKGEKEMWGCGALPEPCPLQKGHGARRLVVLMPGGVEYVTRIRTFTVAKELLQEICEQMGVTEQQEIQDFGWVTLSLCPAGKMVRPIKLEEYLHDYLLEDRLVTVSLRRLIWRTPLHFDNQIYTNVHYGQVSRSRTLSCRDRGGVQANRNVPRGLKKQEGWCSKLLAASCCPQATFCFPLEHVMELPFFGYITFVVERISDATVPGLLLRGAGGCSLPQMVSQAIPLKELLKMRTLKPISSESLPGLELSYGSPASPRTMWVELPQVRSAWTYTLTSASCFLRMPPQCLLME
uniref:Uncharacterized protein n=1 Tax=Malurus cyaneus samueli TaxID=2593467 RepID=A0A8C5X721_9PASS